MKSKRRHQTSSEESEASDGSDKSSSSSASESEESSVSEHRYKKKKKRADSSDSDSDSEDQKRSKKRKHKKKKKKHGKKKKRADSEDLSNSGDDVSVSEGEISPKKKRKHKHKHSKRVRSSSGSVIIEEEPRVERRLHSVVKERRASSEERNQPSRTYYQKEYHQTAPGEEYEREREVQRFYRGSSKERRLQYEEQQYQYNRERNERYAYHQEKYDKNRDKCGQSSHYTNEDYSRRPQTFDGYKRQQRYDEHRGAQEEYHRRPREENYQPREENKGYGRYNQYEDRGPPKRRVYEENRDYRERRGPPEAQRYHQQREYPDKREKYREEGYSAERPREEPPRRDRPGRSDKPHHSQQIEPSRSRSPDSRYRDKRKQEEPRPRDDARRPRDDDRPRSAKPDERPRERKSRFADAEDGKEYSWGKTEVKNEGGKSGDKEKPNFGLSGKLTADQNTVNGVVIKYTEPDDAKQPKRRWRFYPFKGDKALAILYIHRQSAFLIGRDKKVADIALEHPSISKQHAALQYRATPFTRPDGSQGRRVRPYIIDLESANGTFVNNKKVEPRRYVELLERDVVKFGFSLREYVLLHENSKDDAQDDDHVDPEPGELGAAVTTTDKIKQEKRMKQEMAEDGE